MTSWEEVTATALRRTLEGLPAEDPARAWAAANVDASSDLRSLTDQLGIDSFVDSLYEQLSVDLQRSFEVALPLLNVFGELSRQAIRDVVTPLQQHAQGLAERYEIGQQELLAALDGATQSYIQRIRVIAGSIHDVPEPSVDAGEDNLARVLRDFRSLQALMARTGQTMAELRIKNAEFVLLQQKRELAIARKAIIFDLQETDLAHLEDINEKYRWLGALLTHGPAFGGFVIDAVAASYGIRGVLSGPFGVVVGALCDIYVKPRIEERHHREARTVLGVLGVLFGCGVFPAIAIQTARMRVMARLLGARGGT